MDETRTEAVNTFDIGAWVAFGDQETPRVGEIRYFSDDGKTVFVQDGVTRKFERLALGQVRLMHREATG